MNKLLELKNISYGYDQQPVVEGVNLTIHDQDFIGMIGPNGGGKSTIIKVILGLLEPWNGSVVKKENLNIGYLPQYHKFDSKFPITVEEVLVSGLMKTRGSAIRITRKEKEIAREVLKQVGLPGYIHRAIGELSGGQMQRVFIGRAIISQPRLLILDEPDTYVDNRFEHELYELLDEINRSTAVLLVSHDVGQIISAVKTIACVNRHLHYHPSNKISNEILASYNCPIELISHGHVPHRVLKTHDD
ncbi:MAG: ABC transporter ATP-binding protein [Bacteroidales bacterium]|nr:ABC transporter ATP-binding protein [Bacteroidales bacterium]